MRAIGWDHPRCVGPMLAAAEAWRARTGTAVHWEFRPLDAFNDQPLHELAADFDLMIVDHPAVPEAVVHGALAPLDRLLPSARLRRLAAAAIGPSGASYRYAGTTWALAVDAACQVSAWRPALLDGPPPATWPDVLALARREPGRLALPLTAADALCALQSVAATLGRPLTVGGVVAVEAVAVLAALAPLLDERSWDCSPPRLMTTMAAGAEIAYVPLIFGYLALAGDDLRFADAPTADDGRQGAVLGGAGVAVSAASREPVAAARLAAWLCEASTQRDVVLAHGGQPAHSTVWSDPPPSRHDFFDDTRSTMEHAHVRPLHPAWPAFHRAAGADLTAALRAGEPAEAIAARLQRRLDALEAAAPAVPA
ncbi:MAG: multiple sugar transport system substrate-binding protein [Solirubrobacteraceae bacterium]